MLKESNADKAAKEAIGVRTWGALWLPNTGTCRGFCFGCEQEAATTHESAHMWCCLSPSRKQGYPKKKQRGCRGRDGSIACAPLAGDFMPCPRDRLICPFCINLETRKNTPPPCCTALSLLGKGPFSIRLLVERLLKKVHHASACRMSR